ncbi:MULTISPECIES: hypothetical protein [Roseobacteraceae]|uniref:Antibiotic biosynthesis monooxygenase n=1 Tax=Pseudosulfitobacter pseudonitzschiae TaxID=1402135 RepID=A0A221JXH7_9RHOB|nr:MULTISPECIES: hypothetical protein [Roseobacteraceae]ASM71307.1 antibiotic biosynthesis monooxygenase [Pseudosulfitobacter pseudonitzschiae]
MAATANETPAIGHPEAGLILISYWSVDTPALQREAATLAMDLWDDVAWPDGLLSHHVFGGHDGKTVINYAQWRDNRDFETYLASDQPVRADKIENHSTGITRESIDRFHLYRRMDGSATGAVPTCFVLVTFDLAPPAQAQTLVDTIIAAAQPPAKSASGSSGDIASHFHINQDATKVVNVAEFTDAQSHKSLVQSTLQDDSPVIKAISGIRGATVRNFQRFDLLGGRVGPSVEGAA